MQREILTWSFIMWALRDCGRLKAILKLISSPHQARDRPVQTGAMIRFKANRLLSCRFVTHLESLSRLCTFANIAPCLIDCTGPWAWLSACCFQGKWRPRARKRTTMTTTAKRARWMRCVLSCQLIQLLFKYSILCVMCWGCPLVDQWDNAARAASTGFLVEPMRMFLFCFVLHFKMAWCVFLHTGHRRQWSLRHRRNVQSGHLHPASEVQQLWGL